MSIHKTVALIAHDQNKEALAISAISHQQALFRFAAIATGARHQIRPNRDPTHAN